MASRNRISIFAPKVYFEDFEIWGMKPYHILYAVMVCCRIGNLDGLGGGLIRMKIQLSHKFEDIISVENLLEAWREFVCGKRNKPDVQLFAHALIDNILQLHNDLANKSYRHGGYYRFKISDPKSRDISKALVRDRLLHHAVYRILYPFFDRTFISDSYSCRVGKGTHKAVNRLLAMFRKASKNNTRTCWVLKCDIRKFFASIDHRILKAILAGYIPDKNIIWLLEEIIDSFGIDCHEPSALADAHLRGAIATKQSIPKTGLPLGNLTSQLLVNIYMNEFDQFVKHKLSAKGGSASGGKAKYYIRYADDFVILYPSRKALISLLYSIEVFLKDKLRLRLHPNKIVMKTFASGIDFLGWVNFANHRVLRTATKKRMLKKVKMHPFNETLQSYLGLMAHGDSHKLKQEAMNIYWLSQ